jgi:hypothetical protein
MANNNNPIKYSDLVSPDNSITELIKQLDELSDTYTNALKNIRNEAVKLAGSLENVSGATEQGRQATKKAADDADKLAKAQRELAFAESENAQRLAELRQATREQNQINQLLVKINQSVEGSYNRLSAQYSLNKIYLNNMTKEEREATKEGRELEQQTRALYEEMNRLQQATGKYQLNVGNYEKASDAIISYGDNLKNALGLNNSFGESLLKLGSGGEDAKSVLAGIGDGAKALGKTLLGLLSNPVFIAIAGIAGVGAGFKWWYDYNAGLVEATRLTQQFTGKQGDDLKAFRNNVQAVADAFNVDFKETLMASNAVAQQFGISADESLKLIQDGFVSGANANGEFLDTLREYPAYFKEAGISADEFIAIIAETNKQGIFSDKGIDAIKEANIRLREMTTATASALEGIGISSEQVQKDLQNGSKTTFDVMQEVSLKLNELPDSATEVGTAIADIFGSAGEDAGLQYLRTLGNISTNLDEVKDKAGILGQLQEEQLNSQLELENALSGLFDLTGGNFETLTTRAKVFVNDGLTAIIKGVISIINYFIELYNDSLAFRALWQSIVVSFKNGVDTIGNIFGFLIDIVKSFGTTLKGAFTLDFDLIKQGFADYANSYKTLVANQVKDITENVQKGIENANEKIKPITIPVTTSSSGSKDTGNNYPSEEVIITETQTSTDKEIENAYKKNIQIRRKLEDELLKLESDDWKKRETQTKNQYQRQIEDLKHQLLTEKNLTKQNKEDINKTIQALEQQQTQALLKLDNERQLNRLELEKKSLELQLNTISEGSEEELKLRRELIAKEKQIALLQNKQKAPSQRRSEGEITSEFGQREQSVADTYINEQLAIFSKQQELSKSEFELLESTEKQKTLYRLNAEKERLQKVIELNKKYAGSLSEIEIQTIQNTIAKIEKEIENTQKKGGDKKDIYDIFGLDLNDDEKQAITTSVSFAISQLDSYLQKKIEIANAAVEAADKEVDSAQSALDSELQARANGYANNVEMAQRELELAKRNQDKALKEQQRAQKQQEAMQAAQQASSLVTATALIWAQMGFLGALPAIAVMWASFAASKIKAAQLTKAAQQEESYGEGTVELLKGGSHQSGNDIDLGMKPDGTRRRAEGGEFFAVINKRNSRRYGRIIPDIIKSLNSGTFEKKYMNIYDDQNGFSINVNNQTDITELNDNVRKIKEQNKTKMLVDSQGNIILIYKNLKRKIRK